MRVPRQPAPTSCGMVWYVVRACVQVDVFDFETRLMRAPLRLSQNKSFLAVTCLEPQNLVFFGGGEIAEDEKNPSQSSDSNVVEVFSVAKYQWVEPLTLSVARKKLSATSVLSRYVLFGGGFLSNNGSEGFVAFAWADMLDEHDNHAVVGGCHSVIA